MTKKVITINAENISEIDELINAQDKEIEIRGAALKDSFCDYSYELLKGPTKGDTLNHKGTHVIHDNLEEKFNNLDVFFAHLDDAFTGNDNSTSIETLEEEIEKENYHVTGFKISGVEENKSVILVGWKDVTYGVVKFETPKIKFSSSYLYLHQLKVRLFEAIYEVEEYRNGKSAPQEDPNQVHMTFEEEDADFENAKLD